MALYASILLVIAALTGFTMVFLGIRYKRSFPSLAMGHAAAAIAGLVFLGTQIVNGPTNKFNNLAALLLLLAFIGGGMLFALREKNQAPAMMMVFIHASMAIVGLIIFFLGFR